MILIGLVLLILGFVFASSLLETIGVALLAIGALLFVFGAVGHPVAGRRYWF